MFGKQTAKSINGTDTDISSLSQKQQTKPPNVSLIVCELNMLNCMHICGGLTIANSQTATQPLTYSPSSVG